MNVIKGKVRFNGKIGYVSQTPWLRCDSVRANILFGNEMNEERYKKVLQIC